MVMTAEKAAISVKTFSGKGLIGVSINSIRKRDLVGIYNVLPTDVIAGEYMRVPPPDVNLHAYAEDGRHVGVNYETGSYEAAIPGMLTSGDLINRRE
ncbi:MAG: hypothetical protein LM577_03300 [Thermoproteaceae archaeon]|nr:hypothetical protein [Thermoproteaceae archaeon]